MAAHELHDAVAPARVDARRHVHEHDRRRREPRRFAGRDQRGEAAERRADQQRRPAQLGHHRAQVGGVRVDAVVAVGRPVALAVPAQIERDGEEALRAPARASVPPHACRVCPPPCSSTTSGPRHGPSTSAASSMPFAARKRTAMLTSDPREASVARHVVARSARSRARAPRRARLRRLALARPRARARAAERGREPRRGRACGARAPPPAAPPGAPDSPPSRRSASARVDLEEVRAALPDNLYWQSAGAERRPARARGARAREGAPQRAVREGPLGHGDRRGDPRLLRPAHARLDGLRRSSPTTCSSTTAATSPTRTRRCSTSRSACIWRGSRRSPAASRRRASAGRCRTRRGGSGWKRSRSSEATRSHRRETPSECDCEFSELSFAHVS